MLPASVAVSRYSAYGYRTHAGEGVLGFNGERQDPLSGCYHLGNGHRTYNCVLIRFHKPDSLSPFGDGGLNAYAYCGGDPVNRRDPTGRFIDGAVMALRALSMASNMATLAYNFLGPPPTNRVGLNAARISTGGSLLSLVSAAAQFAGVESAIFGANVGTGISVAATATRAIYAGIGPGSRPWAQVKKNWNLMTGGLPVASLPPEFMLEVVTPSRRVSTIPVDDPVTFDINGTLRLRQHVDVTVATQGQDIRRARSLSPRTGR